MLSHEHAPSTGARIARMQMTPELVMQRLPSSVSDPRAVGAEERSAPVAHAPHETTVARAIRSARNRIADLLGGMESLQRHHRHAASDVNRPVQIIDTEDDVPVGGHVYRVDVDARS